VKAGKREFPIGHNRYSANLMIAIETLQVNDLR
jgi:hypothetical protein